MHALNSTFPTPFDSPLRLSGTEVTGAYAAFLFLDTVGRNGIDVTGES